jgi:hypothetical protein
MKYSPLINTTDTVTTCMAVVPDWPVTSSAPDMGNRLEQCSVIENFSSTKPLDQALQNREDKLKPQQK